MFKNKIFKRIGAGLMAGLCAFSMLGTSVTGAITASAAEAKEPAFPSVDTVIAQAATLLGAPYTFGFKGYSGIYYQGQYEPLSESYIRQQGIDCSGLIYYTLTHLGYSTSGFSWNNPVPVDTAHWLTVNSKCTVTYGGVTANIDVEKENLPSPADKTAKKTYEYWECKDGSTITPGSVVVGENPGGIDHAWIYMGEFNSRSDVVAYLKKIGVDESKITTKTVGDGKGDGGTHWRIEASGSEGVVINNKTDGKTTSAMNMFGFRITKRDVTFEIDKYDTDGNLVGKSTVDKSSAVYGIYSDKACKTKVAELTIGANGKGSVSLSNATYYAKELKAPKGYQLDATVHTISAGVNKVTEDFEYGKILINKTADDGVIGDREFKVSWTENGKAKSKTATTNSKGVATFSNLKVYDMSDGKAISYNVSEINVETRYETPKAQNVTLTSGDADFTVTTKFVNNSKKGNIKINKQSEDGQNGDRTFVITGNGKTYTVKTGTNGIAELNDIPVYDSSNKKITYTISEKDVPIRYVTPANQTATLTADATTTKTFNNKLKKFTAEITKVDAETKSSQGDATLEGAEYGLYKDGELVDKYKTDKNGHFKTKEYVCGSYTVKEITPSKGYTLDKTVYNVGAEEKNYTLEHNTVEMTVYESPVKGDISIIKHSDKNDDVIENLEAGAEFDVYLKSAGSYENAKDRERDHLVTDKNGFAKTKKLPYGVYTVHQTKTVKDAELTPDFDVSIGKDGQTYEYTLNNKPFESYVKVVKRDAETGKNIALAGAGFEIYDAADSKIVMGEADVFYTNDEGYLITPETLGYGSYKLIEVQAPEGYVLDSKPVDFTVSRANSTKENAVTVVIVEKLDSPQKGKIVIHKQGEIFSHVTALGSAIWKDEEGNIHEEGYTTFTPHFEKSYLGGAVFEVKAAEDIKTADGTVRAKAGEVVATVTTDKNGFAETPALYLGKYTVTEIKAPYGHVISTESKTVELTYAGQEANFCDIADTSFINDYQGVKIHLSKFMEHDEDYDVGSNDDARRVIFGLYADEEIKAADGSAIPAGGLISYVSIGEDMTATISEQLPFGKYYVQEIATDEKYIINDEKYLVTIEYAGQETDTVEIDCGEFTNDLKRGSVSGLKVDEHDEPLANAVFGIFHTDCEVFSAENAIATAVSDENGVFEINGIPYGSYIVTEIEAPVGYVFSDKKYPVAVSEDGEVVEIKAENKPITISVSKQDIYGKELAGAEMQLFDGDGKTVDEWVSDSTNHVVTNLPAGSYVLHEAASPDGYVISTDISFEVDKNNVVTVNGIESEAYDENGNPTVIMVDDTTKVEISKTAVIADDETTDGEDTAVLDELIGATLQIIDKDGNVVEEWVTTAERHFIEAKLIAGETYVLHEAKAPDGFVIAADIEFTVSFDGSVDKVHMIDDATKVHVSKTDITGDKELEGAKLQVIDENGEIVDEWISTTEAHIIEGKLTAGKEYTLHEEISPDGYVVANDITFTVSEDGSVDVVVMKDDTTKVCISKRDITTDEELPGAKLIVIDEDGNTVEEWVSTSEAHYIEGKLIVGKTYTLREITAPDGFEIANDIQFKVNEDGSVTEVVMYDKHKPTTTTTTTTGNPHTGSDFGVVNGSLAMMAVCGSIMVASKRKKDQEVDE
ncbi:MAG: NPXTG-anchored protein [Ruminococcus sp.]|nr:NPXTG-anchored protein [Ruminococcus sp.]